VNRTFLRLEYSVELLTEYLSSRLIPEVALHYRVAQNKQTLDFLFKFVIRQLFEMSQKMPICFRYPECRRLQQASCTSKIKSWR